MEDGGGRGSSGRGEGSDGMGARWKRERVE